MVLKGEEEVWDGWSEHEKRRVERDSVHERVRGADHGRPCNLVKTFVWLLRTEGRYEG